MRRDSDKCGKLYKALRTGPALDNVSLNRSSAHPRLFHLRHTRTVATSRTATVHTKQRRIPSFDPISLTKHLHNIPNIADNNSEMVQLHSYHFLDLIDVARTIFAMQALPGFITFRIIPYGDLRESVHGDVWVELEALFQVAADQTEDLLEELEDLEGFERFSQATMRDDSSDSG